MQHTNSKIQLLIFIFFETYGGKSLFEKETVGVG